MLQGLMLSFDRVSYSNMGRAHGGVLVSTSYVDTISPIA
jgi:hypothetical protein